MMEKRIEDFREELARVLALLGASAPGCEEASDALVAELRAACRGADEEARRNLGRLVGRIVTARRSTAASEALPWAQVAGGALAIGHRPKQRLLRLLRAQGATQVLTLLSAREGAQQIGEAVRAEGMAWLWFPMESADPPADKRSGDFERVFREMKERLADAARIFVHCSAGIHRTGMVTNGFLRWMGLSAVEAAETLKQLRPITWENVGAARLAWGDRFHGPHDSADSLPDHEDDDHATRP